MYYVYCLVPESGAKRRYVGFTEDLRQRLVDHNAGCNPSTTDARPWRLKGYVAFDNKPAALAFEHYLKTGSGHASARSASGERPAAPGLPRPAIRSAAETDEG